MKKRVFLTFLALLAIAGGGYGVWVTWGVKAEATKPVAVQTVVEAPKSKEVPKVAKVSDDGLNSPTVKGIINETNKYRATKGLAPLVENELLDKSACLKADDMIAKDYWAHNSPDGLTPWYWINQAGYKYKNAGENLAQDYYNDAVLVYAWIKSPTHEANLSGNYTDIGICNRSHVYYQSIDNYLTVAHYGTSQ